jgi:short-subunit dehydrogenase
MKTIAIFGAGPALGVAVARRFGREGFRVALVARDRERLDDRVRELARAGVEAAGFPADLSDRATALGAVDLIEGRFGPIDVLEFSPGGGDASMDVAASQVDVATVEHLVARFLLTSVALVGEVLPGMLERGDGALLFAMAASAKYPLPRWASGGMVLAALRNYALTLHAELAPRGVYAGTLLIGALVEGSEAHRNAPARGGDRPAVPLVSPDDLAEHYWDMYVKRDRAEDEVIPGLTM